jgi:hypothetical protein
LERRWAVVKRGGHVFAILLAMPFSACDSSLKGDLAPHNYSCGTSTISTHCYSVGRLGDHLTGFRSTFTVVANILPGDGFVTNEFWLANDSSVDGWIEVGYIAGRFELPKYFYAIKDPDNTPLLMPYDIGLGPIPQDEINTRVVFDIHQTAEDTFAIAVDGTTTHFSTTVQVNLWNGSEGGYAQLGQELAGSMNAVASFAMFVDNQVYDQSFQRHFATESNGHHPMGSPSEEVSQPPFGGWLELPAAGNQGGVFSTYCCAP